MVNCPHCSIPNSLDSHFCKGCGQGLPQDAVTDAQRQHDELVAEGYKALNDGRTEEAILIASAALEDSPQSVSALSLKGMGLEREGKLAEALEVFEKVVALNPNSALDKIKVQQLRNSISAQILNLSEPAPNRRLAAAFAAAAVILVAALGVLAANFVNRPAGTATNPNLVAERGEPPANDALRNPNVGNKPAAGTDTEATDAGAGGVDPRVNDPNYEPPIRNAPPGANAGNGAARASNPGGIRFPNGNGSGLPEVNSNGGYGPINPSVVIGGNNGGGTSGNPAGNGGGSTGGSSSKGTEDIDPQVGKPDRGTPTDGGNEGSPGIIDIKVSKPGGNRGNGGGGVDIDNGMSMQALLAAAKQQFLLNKFDQAARSYERLLAMGADPASTNQRLGQCYANLGQKSQAVSAYQRAISALENRIKNSSGDTSSLQRQLDSCRQAVKVLG